MISSKEFIFILKISFFGGSEGEFNILSRILSLLIFCGSLFEEVSLIVSQFIRLGLSFVCELAFCSL